MDPQANSFVYPQGTSRNLAFGAAGDIAYQSSPNFTTFVTPGAAGTVLKSNGAGVAPSFQTDTTTASPTYTIYSSGATGTYNSPAGCSYLIVEMVGGGGSGSRNTTSSIGGGGGAGYLKVRMAPGSYAYSVSGTAVAQSGTGDGTAGGNTTFGSLTANGGGAGVNSAVSPASGGNVTTTGSLQVLHVAVGQNGASGATTVCPGGSSLLGSTGGAGAFGGGTVSGGVDARGAGAGGCGVNSSNFSGASGTGSAGRIIIQEFY